MARCAPSKGPFRKNPLPVFPGMPAVTGPIKHSKMGWRRAGVLGAVHLAVLGHIVHWRITGSTLSPVEPSESMRTLELGEVNAGALFFAAAILSTALFGRFFCGWGCHVVALQDLCAEIMRRLGVRPRPFRARLLAWVPLLLALYMFVWPTAKRVVIEPIVSRVAPGAAFLRAPAPFPGFSNHLTTPEFWATFPGVAVAIPFLFVCGFAVVYFLGAKGFCTYGCPYGAFFGIADSVAPGRIRVNENCDGCAHCTSVCTSNVRVHEEVRRFGMVVDAGCMKCLDCVNTCPRDALHFGFGSPRSAAVAGKGRVRVVYDLDWRAEALVAATFLATFLAWRGAYDAVPLLMAVGISLCVTYMAWVVASLLRRPEVHIQNLELKRGGRLQRAAAASLLAAAVAIALTLQSGAAGISLARAESLETALPVAREDVFSGRRTPLPAAARHDAEQAAAWYRRSDGWSQGGIGLVSPPAVALRRAWLALVLERPAEARKHLERAMGDPARAGIDARVDLGRVQALAGDSPAAIRELRAAIAAAPTHVAAHRALAGILEEAGHSAGAVAEWIIVVNLDPADIPARARLVRLLEQLGRAGEAAHYR